MKNKLFGGLLVAMGCAMGLQPAAAATVTFFGTGTALGARADFTTSAGLLAVTVTNTLAPNQIISAAQAVSDIIFTLSNAPGTLGATTASGNLRLRRVALSRTAAGRPVRWLGSRPSPSGRHRFFQHRGEHHHDGGYRWRSAKSDDPTCGRPLPQRQCFHNGRSVQPLR